MAPHSNTLAWKIPWTEEPCRLQSIGFWRVRHNWVTSLSLFTFMHRRRKWQPTRVLAWRIPGTAEPGGLPSMGSHRVGHDWSDLAAAAAGMTSVHHSCLKSGELKGQGEGHLRCQPHCCSIAQSFPGVCWDSCILSQWCHPTISSSATPFSFCH